MISQERLQSLLPGPIWVNQVLDRFSDLAYTFQDLKKFSNIKKLLVN